MEYSQTTSRGQACQIFLRRVKASKRNCSRRIRCQWGSKGRYDESNGGYQFEAQPTSSSSSSTRRQRLLTFVNELKPSHDTSSFDLPAPVLSALRQTVVNLLGQLPTPFFNVTIAAQSEPMAQLMFSVLMTGYMLCNAYYRLELTQSMESVEQTVENIQLAHGSQKVGIEGKVLRWHHDLGVQHISAEDYIEQLEAQVVGLRRELEAAQSVGVMPVAGSNEILEYLKTLSSTQLAELTDCATPEVLEGMNVLVTRMIGDGKGSTCTASELAQILCWLGAVGHQFRRIEIRESLGASLAPERWQGPDDGGDDGTPSWVPRLPPGR